jgi:FlaA1/EpsC-like NDP-sugar epimerase
MIESYKKNKKLFGLEHWMQVSAFLVLYDAVAVALSYFLALLLRFDFRFSMIPIVYLTPWEFFAPLYAVLCILVFWRLRLYRSIWRFASFTELQRITLSTIVTTIIHIVGVTFTLHILIRNTEYTINRMPFSYYIVGVIFQFILVTAIRFSYRFILLLRASKEKESASRIMLIGMHSIIGVP